jgi:CBS domain-containing protein
VATQLTKSRTAAGGYTVGDVMRPAVTTVETGGHLAAAAYLMNHANQSALVVVDQLNRPVALITERDLMRAVAHGENTGEALIVDWMSRDPRTVHPDASLIDAAQAMLETTTMHLPVVADGKVRGIVVIGDVVDALVRSVRLASAVVFVSDLSQSLGFYQSLLRYTVTVSSSDTALLVGPDGSQIFLREVRDGPPGIQWVAWTAGSEADLDRCTRLFQQRGALQRRDSNEGIELVEGRDPDGLPVVITFPGPERVPRTSIPDRITHAAPRR